MSSSTNTGSKQQQQQSSPSGRSKKTTVKVMTKNRDYHFAVSPHVHHREEQLKRESSASSSSSSVVDDCNIFVKYLPSEMGDDSLYELFSPFGVITNCRVMVDNRTRTSLGYGYVRMCCSF
jgi:RNA recognition motif-containing protein